MKTLLNTMKILHLSDTHGCHRLLKDMPEADVIVHSGDFTMNGTESEAIDFLNWYCDLTYANKIVISGNHDDCLYGANIEGLDVNIHFLCNSGIRIDGLNFYGVPMFMGDCITERQAVNIEKIPDHTDVLITHSPPFGVLDFDDNINYGDELLLKKIMEIQPRLHLFGHIHAQHGVVTKNGIRFSNGAIMSSTYDNLNVPNVIVL